jgi:DNA-binding transcriptional LysR family regulator
MGQRQPTVATTATITNVANLQQVEAFIRVAEVGSFTLASELLGLPKSSVSRAVSNLERSLGALLIRRTTRKLVVTPAGERYLQSARGALLMLEQAGTTLREDSSVPSGFVRLTTPQDPTGSVVADGLISFAARYPRIQVEVIFTAQRLDLVAEGIDLAVRAGKLDSSTLAGRRVGGAPIILVASPGYLSRRGAPASFSALAEHECVLYRGTKNRQTWAYQKGRRRESVKVSGQFNLNELSTVLYMVKQGVGIARMPLTAALDGLEDGTLVQVLRGAEWEGDSLYVVHPVQRHLPQRVSLLRDHLYEHLRSTVRGLRV